MVGHGRVMGWASIAKFHDTQETIKHLREMRRERIVRFRDERRSVQKHSAPFRRISRHRIVGRAHYA